MSKGQGKNLRAGWRDGGKETAEGTWTSAVGKRYSI